MPAQLSTILYVSDYKEKTSAEFFIGTALGFTRLDEESEAVQTFNITVFYPVDETRPCYLPKLNEGQILSVANSKFGKSSNNNELDIILTSATVLDIPPEDLPIHQINVVGVGVATEAALVDELGVQIECSVTDYLTKDRPTEMSIILFHPNGSRFTNQTTTVKRGSSLFFSGALSSVENKLYLELHNFSFLRGQQSSFASSSTKHMPWLNSLRSSSISSPDTTPVKSQQPTPTTDTPVTKTTVPRQPSTNNTRTNAKAIHKNSQQIKPPVKRKTRSSFRINKLQKLSDIATNALADIDSSNNPDDVN